MNYTATITATATTFFLLSSMPVYAASFSSLNSDVIKFTASTPEADLISLGAASIALDSTTNIYIGTNQVSANNQDPIVTSFTNGVQNWVQSYDTSGVDGRGVGLGLLWDTSSNSLYGVFTTDGGSTGPNSFSAATQGGWLPSYGVAGTNGQASVLLKLNSSTGAAEAGTYIRSELSNGTTNTVVPTGLDFVGNQVVFFGDSFFTPLDVNGEPFSTQTTTASSPFPYRLVFTPDLSQAVSAEAIGWNGVTQFSSLSSGSSGGSGGSGSGGSGSGGSGSGGSGGSGSGGSGSGGSGSSGGNGSGSGNSGGSGGSGGSGSSGSGGSGSGSSGGSGSGGSGSGGGNGSGSGSPVNPGTGDAASVPEPGAVIGLGAFLAAGAFARKTRQATVSRASR